MFACHHSTFTPVCTEVYESSQYWMRAGGVADEPFELSDSRRTCNPTRGFSELCAKQQYHVTTGDALKKDFEQQLTPYAVTKTHSLGHEASHVVRVQFGIHFLRLARIIHRKELDLAAAI